MMSNSRQAKPTQAPSNTVLNATGQREWKQAFLPFAVRNKYPATVLALADALFEFYFNRKTGQCDPGEDELAGAIACDVRTVRRGVELLKADGWMQLRRGRRGENAQLLPTISDRTRSVLSERRKERRADRTQTAFRPDTKRLLTGHQGVLSITLNTEHEVSKSAPLHGARTADASLDSNVTDDDFEMVRQSYPGPLGDPSKERAALGRALALKNIDAVDLVGHLQQLPERAIERLPVLDAYLASIASTNASNYLGGGVTMTSSR